MLFRLRVSFSSFNTNNDSVYRHDYKRLTESELEGSCTVFKPITKQSDYYSSE